MAPKEGEEIRERLFPLLSELGCSAGRSRKKRTVLTRLNRSSFRTDAENLSSTVAKGRKEPMTTLIFKLNSLKWLNSYEDRCRSKAELPELESQLGVWAHPSEERLKPMSRSVLA
jgi:hypothetical protein